MPSLPDPSAQATIDIDAPIDLVWSVMLDVSRYAEWNPFIVRIDGASPLRVGSRLRLHVRWAKGGGASSSELVTKATPPEPDEGDVRTASLSYVFTGPLHTLFLVRAERTQTLEQAPDGPTRYTTREVFRGFATPFLPLAAVQDGFDRHARALKARAEQLAGNHGVTR